MKHVSWLHALAGLALLLGAPAQAQAPDWSILPQPLSAVPAAEGSVTVANGDGVAWLAGDRAQAQRDLFLARVARLRGLQLLPTNEPTAARIVFRLDPSLDATAPAAYRIEVGNSQIRARAATARGLFHAAITVSQLLSPDAHQGKVKVAAGHIQDRPRFAWRGLMLDSARHFQSVAQIKHFIDAMAGAKLNVLHWHLTDDQGWRLQIKRYPKLTSIGGCRFAEGPDAALTGSAARPYCGYYTQDQVRDIVAYAAARHITVVPEIELPGHAQAALAAYPELGVTGQRPQVSVDWGVNPWLYAPNKKSLGFLKHVLDEVMALFPSRYIHIGGDEARKDQWLASKATQAKRKALGLDSMDQLQGWMVDRIGAYLADHDRIMIGWDEILEGGNLPASAVVMSWRGIEGGIEAARLGHDTILAPSPTMYLDHAQSTLHNEPPSRPLVESLSDIYHFDALPDALSASQRKHILGIQANLWAEYLPTYARVQHQAFPRVAALAEVAWSGHKDWKHFLDRMPAQLARYRAMNVAYADSAWAPAFTLAAHAGKVRVSLANQVARGQIRYTTDGSTPTPASPLYTAPLDLPATRTTTIKAATFTAAGVALAAPRTQRVDAAALRTRNSDQLATCRDRLTLRLEDDRPLDGPRPVYKVNIMDTCWQWPQATLDGMRKVQVTVGNMPWNYALLDKDLDVVVARPDTDPAGHVVVRLDQCQGPVLARMSLAKAATTRRQSTLQAAIPATAGVHDLCIQITGDPRLGRLWAIDTITLSP